MSVAVLIVVYDILLHNWNSLDIGSLIYIDTLCLHLEITTKFVFSLQIRRRVKLEGPELDEFLKKKQEKENEEAKKKAQERRQEIQLILFELNL